jgi:ankyrin repeat protein
VAIRPLDVKELAEVLAVDFDDAEGIPKLKPNWRWEDEEQALLTSCSSLITTVETNDSRVVQFSHFSVKEFLTSERLATSSGGVSHYYIDLEPAHTILAQACMGVLLQPDDHVEENGVEKSSPLAGYAAERWVTHAQFESVSSLLRKAMEYLFDPDMPYFVAWLRLHDIDTYPNMDSSSLYWFTVSTKSDATPLYYAALCGFQDLVEHLVIKYPQHVNATGGRYVTPLVAALGRRHFQTAKLLYHSGAHVNVLGSDGKTPLHSVVSYGDLEMVQALLDYKADVNPRGEDDWTPMHFVSKGSVGYFGPVPQSFLDVALLLLEHGADVSARTNRDWTPLHIAAEHGKVEVARALLEHGANVGAEDNEGKTPLHIAAEYGSFEIARILLERGANVGSVDKEGRTPFQIASARGKDEIMELLSEHGTSTDSKGVL